MTRAEPSYANTSTWHYFSTFFIATLWLCIVMGVFIASEVLFASFLPETAPPAGHHIAFIIAAAHMAGLATIFAITLLSSAPFKSLLSIAPFTPKQALISIGIACAMIAAYDLAMYVTNRPIVPEFMQQLFANSTMHWPLWLAFVVTAPLFEEFLFRGLLFSKLQYITRHSWLPIILTSFIWAIIHFQYDIVDISIIFIAGIFLGFIRLKSGSIWLAILLHTFWNAVATIQTELLVHNIW